MESITGKRSDIDNRQERNDIDRPIGRQNEQSSDLSPTTLFNGVQKVPSLTVNIFNRGSILNKDGNESR